MKMLRAKSRRRGSVLVEFALLLPIIMLFIAFSIDAGRYLNAHSNATEITQAGARAVAQTGGQIDQDALNVELGVDAGVQLVVVDGSCTQASPYVSVTGSGQYPSFFARTARAMSFGATGTFMENWSFDTTATARCEIAFR